MENNKADLKVGEPHPAAFSAMEELIKLPYTDLVMWQDAFASCAIEGNRLGEICSETLSRVMKGQPVSDRYLLGLSWAIFHGKIKAKKKRKEK